MPGPQVFFQSILNLIPVNLGTSGIHLRYCHDDRPIDSDFTVSDKNEHISYDNFSSNIFCKLVILGRRW